MHMNVAGPDLTCVFTAQFIASNKLTKLNLNSAQMTAGTARHIHLSLFPYVCVCVCVQQN